MNINKKHMKCKMGPVSILWNYGLYLHPAALQCSCSLVGLVGCLRSQTPFLLHLTRYMEIQKLATGGLLSATFGTHTSTEYNKYLFSFTIRL